MRNRLSLCLLSLFLLIGCGSALNAEKSKSPNLSQLGEGLDGDYVYKNSSRTHTEQNSSIVVVDYDGHDSTSLSPLTNEVSTGRSENPVSNHHTSTPKNRRSNPTTFPSLLTDRTDRLNNQTHKPTQKPTRDVSNPTPISDITEQPQNHKPTQDRSNPTPENLTEMPRTHKPTQDRSNPTPENLTEMPRTHKPTQDVKNPTPADITEQPRTQKPIQARSTPAPDTKKPRTRKPTQNTKHTTGFTLKIDLNGTVNPTPVENPTQHWQNTSDIGTQAISKFQSTTLDPDPTQQGKNTSDIGTQAISTFQPTTLDPDPTQQGKNTSDIGTQAILTSQPIYQTSDFTQNGKNSSDIGTQAISTLQPIYQTPDFTQNGKNSSDIGTQAISTSQPIYQTPDSTEQGKNSSETGTYRPNYSNYPPDEPNSTPSPIQDYILSGTLLCEQDNNNAWLDVEAKITVVANVNGTNSHQYAQNKTNTYGQFNLSFNRHSLLNENPAVKLQVESKFCPNVKINKRAVVDLSGRQLEYKFGPILLQKE